LRKTAKAKGGNKWLLAGFGVLAVVCAWVGFRYFQAATPRATVETVYQTDDLYSVSNKMFKRGRRDRREVCLTIDDGPHLASLPRILQVLKDFDVKATFFMVGRRIMEHPEQVREVLREGHEVGNHTQNHNRLDTLTPDQIRMELSFCEHNFCEASGGSKMYLFRAPGMRISPYVLKVAREFGYTTVSGNYGAKDFQLAGAGPTVAGPQLIASYVLDNITPGGIILLHDSPETAEALPVILKGLKDKGYAIRTVTEMMEDLPEPIFVQSNAGRLGKVAIR
jgi:peptidoglycan/xylan/chitin deacetylase (PgdA/CDA1 family)